MYEASCQRLLRELARLLPGVNIELFDRYRRRIDDATTTISIREPAALIEILRAPRGLGLARAWVKNSIEITGNIDDLARSEHILYDKRLALSVASLALLTILRDGFGAISRTGPAEIELTKRNPGRHSIKDDLEEIDFHYSLPVEFYSSVLGDSMTYSCAIFPTDDSSLELAQGYKHAMIERKLGLQSTDVMLDIGCGWGGFLKHASTYIDCDVIGITASVGQYQFLRQSMTNRVRVYHGDYRELLPIEGITAAASIGMYEHVGRANSPAYFRLIKETLPPGGRFLNQSIIRRRCQVVSAPPA